jgi:hypothetical protein
MEGIAGRPHYTLLLYVLHRRRCVHTISSVTQLRDYPLGGGFLVIWQFVPAIRRVGPPSSYPSGENSDTLLCVPQRYIGFHRINGYLSLLILFPALLFGMIVSRHAFGGDISDQAGFYCLGILGSLYGVQGILNVRDTRRHRRWMLRTSPLSKMSIMRFLSHTFDPLYRICWPAWRCRYNAVYYIMRQRDHLRHWLLLCCELVPRWIVSSFLSLTSSHLAMEMRRIVVRFEW